MVNTPAAKVEMLSLPILTLAHKSHSFNAGLFGLYRRKGPGKASAYDKDIGINPLFFYLFQKRHSHTFIEFTNPGFQIIVGILVNLKGQ